MSEHSRTAAGVAAPTPTSDTARLLSLSLDPSDERISVVLYVNPRADVYTLERFDNRRAASNAFRDCMRVSRIGNDSDSLITINGKVI